MKSVIFAAGLIVVFLSLNGVGTLREDKVHAQAKPVELSVPRMWGKVIGTVGRNILFEAPDGIIREVNLVGGQVTVVTLLTRN